MTLNLCSCLGTFADVQDRVESTPCTLSTKLEPDSRALVAGIHLLAADFKAWMAGTSPAMTNCRFDPKSSRSNRPGDEMVGALFLDHARNLAVARIDDHELSRPRMDRTLGSRLGLLPELR